jgi:AcrR family transcriptional regulator
MEAALTVFAGQGFERATVDEMVREAGFSKGAFYVHFESKEDLFWQMLEERIARQQDTFRQALDHERPMVENVRTILEAVFQLVEGDPLWSSLFMEFGAHASRNEKVRERLAAMYGRWRAFLEKMLRESQEEGRVRKDIELGFAASLLMATVEGAIMHSRLAPQVVRLNRLVEPLSRTFAEWLAP